MSERCKCVCMGGAHDRHASEVQADTKARGGKGHEGGTRVDVVREIQPWDASEDGTSAAQDGEFSGLTCTGADVAASAGLPSMPRLARGPQSSSTDEGGVDMVGARQGPGVRACGARCRRLVVAGCSNCVVAAGGVVGGACKTARAR